MIIKLTSVLAGISLASLFAPNNCYAQGWGGYYYAPLACGQPSLYYPPPVITHVSQPCCGAVSNVQSSGGLDAAAYGIQLAPGERLVSPPVAISEVRTSSGDITGRLQDIKDVVDEINRKVP